MDMLQSVIGVAATVLLVLAFCSTVKAVCRKMLRRDPDNKK